MYTLWPCHTLSVDAHKKPTAQALCVTENSSSTIEGCVPMRGLRNICAFCVLVSNNGNNSSIQAMGCPSK